jgi:alpha-D-ribose 1-methylphosphonate 5-triphosphate diphosphatase
MAHDAQIACAGITTVFDSLALIGGRKTNNRHLTLDPMIQGITRAQQAGMLRADHRLHLRCEVVEEDVVDRFSRYLDNPLLTFMSLMDHSPGQRQFPSIEMYRKFHVELLSFDEARIDEIIAERVVAARTHGPRNRETLAEIGRARALPIASHDDETVAHVEEAAELGVTVAEFPTTLEAARASRAHGMQIVMGAPNLVRGGSHSGNIAAGMLAEHDLLDIMSSDYVPVSMLQAAFRLTEPPYGFPLPKAVATVSANPARAGGLGDRGTIAAGLRADLIRVRLADGVPVVRGVWREGRRVA